MINSKLNLNKITKTLISKIETGLNNYAGNIQKLQGIKSSCKRTKNSVTLKLSKNLFDGNVLLNIENVVSESIAFYNLIRLDKNKIIKEITNSINRNQ